GVVDLGRGPAETAGVSLGDDVVDLEAFGGGAAFTGVGVDVGALPAAPGGDGPADAGRAPPWAGASVAASPGSPRHDPPPRGGGGSSRPPATGRPPGPRWAGRRG